MTAKLEPRSSGADMIGGAFAFHLDQYCHVYQIFAIPRIERMQQLKSLTFRIDSDVDTALSGRLIRILARIVTLRRQVGTSRWFQFEF